MDRRGLRVPLNTERLRILTRVFRDYGGRATQQALTIQAHLLRVNSADSEQVAFLVGLYRRAIRGEDVLREHPQLRLLPIDAKPF